MERLEFLDLANDIILEDNKERAIEIICKYIKEEEFRDIISILIDAFQLYGYIEDINDYENIFLYDAFDIKLHTYDGKIIKHLNNGQLSLINAISENEKVLVSAPTSFGKTTIILEYIINNVSNLNNIIFILPTKSLIEELYIKLLNINKRINYQEKYNITLNILKHVGKTIRILTPEKFLNYYEYNNLNNIDLIVMDEVYKIENDGRQIDGSVVDNRSYKFRKVLELISNTDRKVVALSPYTYEKEESMKKYMEKYRIIEINRKTKYVYHEYVNLSKPDAFASFFECDRPLVKNYSTIPQKVNLILEKIKNDKNIIYISDITKGLDIIELLEENNINFLNIDVSQQIKDRYNIFISHLKETYNFESGKDWYVISALKMGIGIYVSSMPRYVKKEIIQLYDAGIINCLFVTTSFIEGVNCTAENIIITSGCTARNIVLNVMSLLNISGRAGRFGKKYVGKVIFINEDVYNKVKSVKDTGVSIRNPNYEHNNTEILRDDYEIEMIDETFLNTQERTRKNFIETEIRNINNNIDDFKKMSISAQNEWKIKIYNYLNNNQENIAEYKEYINNITSEENENVLTAIINIFHILKEAGIEFKNDFSNVSAFSRDGDFIWGELYKYHIDGNIKKVLNYNKNRIIKKKEELSISYYNKSWVRSYFNDKGEFNYNKLYEETFKFISNIIEYKIPYYISLFINVYIYYISKNNTGIDTEMDISEIMTNVENMGIEKEFINYYEYGFSKEMIEKIKSLENELTIENIENIEIFDSYEKIMIKEYLELIN